MRSSTEHLSEESADRARSCSSPWPPTSLLDPYRPCRSVFISLSRALAGFSNLPSSSSTFGGSEQNPSRSDHWQPPGSISIFAEPWQRTPSTLPQAQPTASRLLLRPTSSGALLNSMHPSTLPPATRTLDFDLLVPARTLGRPQNLAAPAPATAYRARTHWTHS